MTLVQLKRDSLLIMLASLLVLQEPLSLITSVRQLFENDSTYSLILIDCFLFFVNWINFLVGNTFFYDSFFVNLIF